MEQLGQEDVGAQLHQGNHGRVVKGGVGLATHPLQISGSDLIPRETAQDRRGDLGVGPSGEGRDLFGGELGPGFGDIEPAVRGQARQDRVDEADGGRAAACGDVAHQDL